jgi:hypothetical protein
MAKKKRRTKLKILTDAAISLEKNVAGWVKKKLKR